MKFRIWYLSLALLLFGSSCTDLGEEIILEVSEEAADEAGVRPQSLPTTSGGAVDPDSCPFSIPVGVEIACGYLAVPEDRQRSGSATIDIAYAIVSAREAEGRPPLVYLAGGPGGSAIDDFLADPEGWDYPFTRARDLILLDQRGTGYSRPTLDCPELAESYEFEDENPEVRCHERLLEQGIDLSAYNTVENAADVEALRQHLGIPTWDLLGISYGTRLALNIMRDYPQGVRSAVLDSVFPPNADTPTEEALAVYRSLERLFAECAADPYCDGSYPQLEPAFLETVATLNERPVDGIYGDDLVFAVADALNDTALIPLVPWVIDAVAAGDVGALEEIATGGGAYGWRYQPEVDRSDSEGMYNSVVCHEEYSFGDYKTVEARVVATVPEEIEAALLQPVADLFYLCSYWAAGTAGAAENEAVYSEIPTLLLAGQYDHATPPEYAWLAAETLGQAFVYEFPGAGHSLLSADECAMGIATAFLDAPAVEPDTSCIDDLDWPYFE